MGYQGAMYPAPPDLSLEELNRRLPLGIAPWHEHTNLCLSPGVTRPGASGDRALSRDPRFGPRGSIPTEAECRAAGGRFRPRASGWMVHVNFTADGEAAWEHHH